MSQRSHGLGFVCLVLLLGGGGCSSRDVIDLIFPQLQGTWDYQMNNAEEATFTGCTGDLVHLEDATFHDGMAMQPICVPSGSIEVLQVDDRVTLQPTTIGCSDGSTAVLSGSVRVTETTVSGDWTAASTSGATMQMSFTGTISGNTIALEETRLSVSGDVSGSCDLSPALDSTVLVRP